MRVSNAPPAPAFRCNHCVTLRVVLVGTARPMTGPIYMPKGNLCPDCQTYTLQRISTNWMQCSTCGLKKKVS